jgi:hypothetical protein
MRAKEINSRSALPILIIVAALTCWVPHYSSAQIPTYGNTQAQEYGDAVYRQINNVWLNFFGADYNHTAIYAGMDSAHIPKVMEATGEGSSSGADTTAQVNFSDINNRSGLAYYGAYTKNNLSLSFAARKSIVSTAVSIVDANIPYVALDAINYYSGGNSVTYISEIRCDAVVEYSYNANGYVVWWPSAYPSYWNLLAYPSYHNDAPTPPTDPSYEFSPWAQRGAPGGSFWGPSPGNTYMTQPSVINLPTAEVTQVAGNGYVDVTIRATDESGIHLIAYIKPGETNVNYCPTQPQHPLSDSLSYGPIRITMNGTFQVAAMDNGGNVGNANYVINIPDAVLPTVTILTPTTNPTCSTSNGAISLSGSASDDIGVSEVTWSNSLGGSGLAAGTTSWNVSNIPLQSGTNVITVTAYDAANNTGTDTINVVYVPVSPLTLVIVGIGAVSPNLNNQMLQIGRPYTMTATPGVGYIFSDWTGTVTGSTPSLTFVMQSNMVLQAHFVPNPFNSTAGVYQGLFYDTNGATHLSSGFFNATATSSGNFTAKLLSSGKSYSFKGRFSGTGYSSNSIVRKGLSPLSIQLQIDLAGGHLINGQVTDGTWIAELLANRCAFNLTTNPAPEVGKYTLVIPGSNGSHLQPGGDSFGTVTVDSSGNVSFKGTLSDGSKVSQKAILSEQGLWPFYVTLYSGNGSMLGWLTFTNQVNNDISGVVDWFKLPQAASKLYPLGFTVESEALGSAYQFQPGVRVLNFSTGQVQLDNGNLSQSVTNHISLDASSKVTGEGVNLTVTTTFGLFKGSVLNPISGRTIPFNGVVLQKQNLGSGYFIGTSESGRIYWGP